MNTPTATNPLEATEDLLTSDRKSMQRIQFKNKSIHGLYLESRLDELLTLPDANGSLATFTNRWRHREIRDILLFQGPGHHDDEVNRLVGRLGSSHLNVIVIPVTGIRRDDNKFFAELNAMLRDRLEESPGLLLYSGEDAPDVLSYAAILLMELNPGPRLSTPEGAIQFLARRDELKPEDLRVFRYKKYLDKSYSIPDAVLGYGENGGNGAMGNGKPSKGATTAAGAAIAGAAASVAVAATGDGSMGNGATVATADGAMVQSPKAKEKKADKTATKTAAPKPRKPAMKFETPSEAPVPTGATSEAAKFAGARFFNIRNKMLVIISGIIVAALGTMIFLASFFYGRDIRGTILTNNLELATIIGQKNEIQFGAMRFKAALIATTMLQKTQSAAEKKLFIDLFFQNNPEFIFVGVARSGDGRLTYASRIYQEKFLQDNQITRERLQTLASGNEEYFLKSLNRVAVVRNSSQGMPIPLLGISIPFGDETDRLVVTAFVDPSTILASFKKSGIVEKFMVDGEGNIIAHQDKDLVLAAGNVAKIPIIERLRASKINNGQSPYDYDNEQYLGSFYKMNFAGLGVVATAKEVDILYQVNLIERRNLIITGIVLFTSILIVFFFARTLTVPIIKLLGATEEVDRGNYTVRMNPTNRDEIGHLTNSFSNMTMGLEKGERLKDVMRRMSNPVIVEMAAAGQLALGGSYKEAAIFFSDLRGFTAMSEKMTPEEVVIYLNEYFTDMVGCVTNTHGVVDKFIGDAIMAHWGAIPSEGNVTENAVNAGLCMRYALIAFNERGGDTRPFAKFGCGINTGDVISGQIGSDERYEYTVIGDAVNLASRIEQLNKPFGTDVLISQDSYDRVRDIFNVEAMPAIKVKGKAEPQTIYAVLGRKDDPNCPANMNEVRARTGGDPPTVDLDNYSDAKEEKFEVVG